jgi:hypothetical protein
MKFAKGNACTPFRKCEADVTDMHIWDVRTGERAAPNCGKAEYWYQDCPEHGSPNTVQFAMYSGVNKQSAKLAGTGLQSVPPKPRPKAGIMEE